MTSITIGFWNTRRLSGKSSVTKQKYIMDEVKRLGADLMLLCEVVGGDSVDDTADDTGSQDMEDEPSPFSIVPQNLTHRAKNPWQLCYACMDKAGANVELPIYNPMRTKLYPKFGFKDGNDFSQLTNRGVGVYKMGLAGVTFSILGFHAPADNSAAAKAVAYVLSDLYENHRRENWLLLGDMNIEPADFNAKTGNYFSALMVLSGGSTHHGRTEDKEYDYGFTNAPNWKITNYRRTLRPANGDHNPIAITLTF